MKWTEMKMKINMKRRKKFMMKRQMGSKRMGKWKRKWKEMKIKRRKNIIRKRDTEMNMKMKRR